MQTDVLKLLQLLLDESNQTGSRVDCLKRTPYLWFNLFIIRQIIWYR